MSETDMAKVARLVADPHAEAVAAKDAEIAALREALKNVKIVDGYSEPYIGVIADGGCWSIKIEGPGAVRLFRAWMKQRDAALEMSGRVK